MSDCIPSPTPIRLHKSLFLRPRAAGATTAACQKAELRVGQAPIHADVPPGRVNGGNGRGKDNRPGWGGWVDLEGPK